jgi:beta-lactamase regulating signal transducer with metallopeptidase domain/thiol-disulfide isomerase/thioredoxin
MNEWLNLPDGGWWYVAGWTMLHFLWLGTLVGLVAGVCRLVLRRASANLRYATALVCLVVLAVLPLGIAAMLVEHYHATSHVFQKVGADAATGRPILHRVAATPPWIQPSAPGSAGGLTSETNKDQPAPITTAISLEPAIDANTTANPRQSRGLTGVFAAVVEYLPWAWFVGSPLTLMLLTAGVIGGERLRRSSRFLDDGPIAEACAEFVAALGIGRRVTVAICERIAAPVLVGIVRPMILLPPAALTGWSPDEIEMVLLHELAHVRRWDNLVNLVQRFVEAALFFHPVVWLVSRWIRAEREACCDAVVVGRTNQPHAYAEMLVALAAQMPRSVLFHPAASSAMAAGPLRGRVRRILGLQDDPMLVSGKSLGAVMGSLLVVATLLMFYLPQETTAEEAKPAAEKNVADEQARRVESMNDLKYLALALHNYHDAKSSLPAAASYDSEGRPLLSWRVHILPYLDGNATGGGTAAELYKEFHLDEPWDSAHNKKLIARIPEVFGNPNAENKGLTNYLAVVGAECVFDGTPRGIRFQDISDAMSGTIMLVEADKGVEWTRPDDYEFASATPKTGLDTLRPNGFIAAYADGSIHLVDMATPLEETRELFTRGAKTDPLEIETSPEIPVTSSSANFPSLEDQKLADAAYRRLGFELEAIGDEDQKRVKALGYEGGLLVTANNGQTISWDEVKKGDILVGVHVWPTASIQELLAVLNRDDLGELNPLKYYIVRSEPRNFGGMGGRLNSGSGGRGARDEAEAKDVVITRRISVPPAELPRGPMPTYLPPAPQPMLAAPAPNSLTESEKQQLKAAGGVRIEFFFHPGSEPCTKAAKLIPKYEKEYPGLVKVDRINVAEHPEAAKDADVGSVPSYRLYLGERPVLNRTGEMTVEQLDSTLASIARHEAYEPQVSMVKPQPELRYAGKTFGEWRTIWQTELSLERRLEVVKALAAFGASGRGKEAAQAILDVANQLDWTAVDFNAPSGKLKQGCIDAFTTGQSTEGYRIPVKDWWPLVVPIYENSPEKSTIVTYLSYQLPAGEKELIPKLLALSQKGEGTRNLALSGLKAVDPQLQDDRVVLRLRELLMKPSEPPAQLQSAINQLLYTDHYGARGGMGGGMGGPVLSLRWVPELQAMLFHPDVEVRQTARFAVSHIQKKDAAPLVEYLIHIIDTQGSGRQRREAIRALGALGPHAAPAEDKLLAIAHERTDPSRFVAAAALMGIQQESLDLGMGRQSQVNKVLGAAPGETLDWEGFGRKIDNERQEILGVYSPSPGEGGGMF